MALKQTTIKMLYSQNQKEAVKRRTGLETHFFGKIISGITFGEDTNIGANAVMLSDLPPGTTAVGMSINRLKSIKAQEND